MAALTVQGARPGTQARVCARRCRPTLANMPSAAGGGIEEPGGTPGVEVETHVVMQAAEEAAQRAGAEPGAGKQSARIVGWRCRSPPRCAGARHSSRVRHCSTYTASGFSTSTWPPTAAHKEAMNQYARGCLRGYGDLSLDAINGPPPPDWPQQDQADQVLAWIQGVEPNWSWIGRMIRRLMDWYLAGTHGPGSAAGVSALGLQPAGSAHRLLGGRHPDHLQDHHLGAGAVGAAGAARRAAGGLRAEHHVRPRLRSLAIFGAGFDICVDLLGVQQQTGWAGRWRFDARDASSYHELGREVAAQLGLLRG